MVRAVSYSRFSSDLQREESIEAQERAIKKFCDDNGYTLLNTYADRGISGTSDERPQFQRMIADASKDLFDVVLVHKLDRFSRNRYNSAVYKNILKKNGVRLISVLENLQDTPESIILESVIEGMNEYYSKNLSREVRKGLQENALACKVTGGPPALGYSVDKSTQKYIINEHEAVAVRMIFDLYLEGYSYTKIIAKLNEKGFVTRRGLPFGKNSLYEILKNERYTGVYVYIKDATKTKAGKYSRHAKHDPSNIIRIQNGMPIIIEKEKYDKVQEMLKARQHKAAKFTAKQDYLLSGKIICGVCGSPFAGNSRRPRPDHPLYISYKCTRHSRDLKCTNSEINRDKLEAVVLEHLATRLFNPDVIPRLVKEYNSYIAAKVGSSRERLAYYTRELQLVDRKINNTVNLMIEVSSPALKDKLLELEQSKQKLVYEIAVIRSELEQAQLNETDITRLFLCAKEQLKSGTLENRRMIIEQYIDKVVVFEDRVEIHLNMIGDFKMKEIITK